MLQLRVGLFCVLPIGVLAATASAQDFGTAELSVGGYVQVDGGGRKNAVPDVNSVSYSASAENESLGDINKATGEAEASATRALKVGPALKPLREFPGNVHARAYGDVFGDQFKEDYDRNPTSFNRGRIKSVIATAGASLQYGQTWIVSADASDAVKNTPIPLDIRVVWAVNGSTSSTTAGESFDTGVGIVSFSMNSGRGVSTFTARTFDGEIVTTYSGFDDRASDALEDSGGRATNPNDSSPYTAKSFEYLAYPNNRFVFNLSASAGASMSANVNNDWVVTGGGLAYLDPIVRVHPSYPYLDQLELIVDDGYYIDVQELYNPLAGTPFEPIGVSLINAPYNTVPIPEPHTWVLLLGGVGLILARARHRASTAH